MPRPRPPSPSPAAARVARTIRFPAGLRERLALDASRCARSFEAHVLAILRAHYGEDVDLRPPPSPAEVLALARASAEGIPHEDWRRMARGRWDQGG